MSILFDVITVGSATVDVFADTSSQMIKFLSNSNEKDFIAYPSGTKILISKLQFEIGGGGTNTATSFSRLGLKTGFLGKLGDDDNSFKVIHLLEEENISFLGSRGGQTGYSIILDSIEHDRTILTFKGSNDELMIEDIDFDKLKTHWLYSSSMMKTSFETIKFLFKKLNAEGVNIAFNPSSYQVKAGISELSETLKLCKIIVMNKEEAELLLQKQGSVEELAVLIRRFDEQYVVITDGPRGAVCLFKNQFFKISPTPDLKVVESTGAGDAFASGFVAGLIKKFSLEDSLKLGMVQAESVIQNKGAKTALLDFSSANAQRASFRGKIEISEINASNIKDPRSVLKKIQSLIKFKAPVGKEFHLSNGQTINSLDELAYYLKFSTEREISRHFYDSGNDFAEWIKDVFGESDLAEKIRLEKDHFVISKILINFIHKKR